MATTYSGTFAGSLYQLTLDGEGTGDSNDGDFAGSFPYFTMDGEGEQRSSGDFKADISFALSATGLVGNAGILAGATQYFELAATGIKGGVGTAALTLPFFTLYADESAGTAALAFPFFILEARGQIQFAVDYVAVMNILNFAMSEYRNFNFNSYCAMGDVYLGADANGIHQLYGNDDNGEEIALEIEKTGMGFNSGQEKRPVGIFLNLYSDGDFSIEVIADQQSQLYLENNSSSKALRTYKVEPGKGLKGRYLGFNIKNLKGSDLALTQVAMEVEVLSRRARG